MSRGQTGCVAHAQAAQTRTAARIEEFEFLREAGEAPARAALRAGWPTVSAAARALYRRGHPAAREVEAEGKQKARAA